MPEARSLSIVRPADRSALGNRELDAIRDADFGWVDHFDMYLSHALQTPEGEHRLLGCAVVCAAIGRQVRSPMRWETVLPNVWILILGPSGVGKSVRVRKARSMLAEAMPDRLLPSTSTNESLMELLKDLTPAELADRKEKCVPAYLGSGMVIKDEISKHFRQIQSPGYMASAAEQLIELGDGAGPVDLSTKANGIVRISEPCLGQIGATTYSRFADTVRPELSSSGYLPRYVFQALDSRPLTTPQMADAIVTGDWAPMIRALVEIRHLAGRATVLAQWSEHLLNRWQDYRLFLEHERKAEPREDDIAPYYERFPAHVLKLAMLLSYVEGAHSGNVTSTTCTITEASVLLAIQMVEHSRETVRGALESMLASPMVREAARLVHWLKAHGGEASQRDVMRNLHWDADTARKVRQTAESRGDIEATNPAWRLVSA